MNKPPASLTALLMQLDRDGITDYRRYQTVRTYLNFRAREKNIPINGTFELTPLCNLDCKMCYVHLSKDQMCGTQLLDTAIWKQLMKDAVDAGMMYARLTGGECLTYPGFKELYLYLRDMGVETSILSNGVLMDADMVEFLKENPPASVQITVYGASEDGYEQVTGSRVFSRVIDNIHLLTEAKIPLSIGVTPSGYMTDGEEIIRLLHRLGLPFRVNAGLMTPRVETGSSLLDADLDSYVRMTRLRNTLKGQDDYIPVDENSLPDPVGNNQTQCGVTCGAGRSAFSIGWNGIMRPCNNFPCTGVDVLALGFDESWHQTNEYAKSFPLPAECVGCPYKSICKHCVAEHASGAPIGHANPAICAWGGRMVAEGILKL